MSVNIMTYNVIESGGALAPGDPVGRPAGSPCALVPSPRAPQSGWVWCRGRDRDQRPETNLACFSYWSPPTPGSGVEMSTLRVLVGCKRVIDYAVKVCSHRYSSLTRVLCTAAPALLARGTALCDFRSFKCVHSTVPDMLSVTMLTITSGPCAS